MAPTDLIDFSPKTPASNPPIDFGPKPDLPSLDTTSARAYMFQQGLNPVLNMDRDDITAHIASGKEGELRTNAALGVDVIKSKLKEDALRIMSIGQTPADPDVINKISSPILPTDPRSVAEEAWGQQYQQLISDSAHGNMRDTPYAQAQKDNPRLVEDIKRRGGIVAAQNQIIGRFSQDAEDAINKQGNLQAGFERAKSFVPFYDEAIIRSALSSIVSPTARIGLGSYLDDVAFKLLTMPFPQFVDTMHTVFEPLIKSNPHEARYILDSIANGTGFDKYLQNFSTALDVTSIPGFGLVAKGVKGLAGLAKSTKEVAEVTADGLKSLKSVPKIIRGEDEEAAALSNVYEPGTPEWYQATKERAAQAAGDMKEAGIQKAAKAIGNTTDISNVIENVRSLTANLRSIGEKFMSNPGDLGEGGREVKLRILNKVNAQDGKMQYFLANLRRTETLSDIMADETLARVVEKDIKDKYRGTNNSIQEVYYKGLHPLSNTYQYELHFFQPDGQPWSQIIQAEGNRNLNNLTDAKVERAGMGFKLVRTINLDEGLKSISELISTTEEGKLKGTWSEGWFSWQNKYRTPRDTLAFDENMQRQLATHPPGVLLGLAREELRPIEKAPKGLPFTNTRKKWRQFQQALNHANYENDPVTGEPGHWFETGQDMDHFFLTNFNRTADPIEKEAYLAAVRNVEADRIYSSIRLYSNKAKWGGEQHQISYRDAYNKEFKSGFFDGRVEREFKNIPADATVYIQVGPGEGYIDNWGKNTRIANMIKKGELQAVELFSPRFKPLAAFGKTGDARIQWVISNKFETKPLEWDNQIPRRGGFHHVYDYNHYLKQANIVTNKVGKNIQHWLEGDTTIMGVPIRAMGKEVAKKMNIFREHLKAGNEDAARDYHNSSGLPMSYEEHRNWYKESHEGGVYKPAKLNVNEPIHLVPSNKTVADVDTGIEGRYGKTFRDSSRTGDPSRRMQVQFTGERDAMDFLGLNDIGSVNRPIYTLQAAKLVDPIHIMNRALTKAVNSIWMQDMKNYSMNHWLKQAVSEMDVEGEDKLKTVMHSPSWYFNNPRYKRGADPDTVAKLESARYQIRQFQGMPSETDSAIHVITQRMADMLYGKFGPKVVPNWLLGDVRDPAAYLRSMIVHMKLGLFSPTSFFVQASTHLNIWGIAGPSHAAPGSAAMLLHSWSRLNKHPEILEALDKKATYFGYKPGQWLEAHNELELRNFDHLGHNPFIDAYYQAKLIRTKLGQILDWGQTPFRAGAESVRTAAWFTAYHEYRNGASWTKGAHPTGALTKQEWDRIQNRATDLDHNMDRASASRIQSGLMSFPMQFQTYHLRLLELMTGKRLTPREKASLFLTTSIAYGVPLGGLGLYGGDVIPVYSNGQWTTLSSYLKRSAQEAGYTPGDSFFKDVFMRGLGDALHQQIFGDQTNMAERWGPGKFDNIDNLVQGNIDWLQMATGAAGSTLGNLFQDASPLMRSAMAFISGDPKQHPMKPADWLRPLEEISSVSDIVGFIQTVETGVIFSKLGTPLGSVDDARYRKAFERYVVGLTPERISAIHDNFEWQKHEQERYNWAEKNIIREMQGYYDARRNNDDKAAEDYYNRARSYTAGIPSNVLARIWAQAARAHGQTLQSFTEQKRFLKNVPPGQEQTRRDIYQKLQQGQ